MAKKADMTAKQYEGLCRYFLATELGIPIAEIKDGDLPGSRRPSSPELEHQIDLYWTTGNALQEYFNIANAKWRTDKVKVGEVLLLDKVKDELHANKAVMITNRGFQSGAKAQANDKRIGLYVVQPQFDYSRLDRSDLPSIVQQITALAARKPENTLYKFDMVCRAIPLFLFEQTPNNGLQSTMSDTYLVRIFLDRPDWRGISTNTISEHAGVVGPDVFTPSSRLLVLSSYHEDMRIVEGKQSMVLCVEFTAWQQGQPAKGIVQDWKSLFGDLPIPRAVPGT